MAFRSVFVPLDGSRFGEYALPYALGLARSTKARLELAHVYDSDSYTELSLATAIRHDKEAVENGRTYLVDVERRVRAAAPAAEVASTLLQGRVAEALCESIGRTNPDLVVLTTHGRGPLSRFWLGSVATELVQCSPIPVLLVRPKEGPPDLAADPAPRRILIPLDGSPFGERIIPVAVAVGEVTGAGCRLLRVVPPVLSSGGGGLGELGAASPTVADQLGAEASRYLGGLTARTPGLTDAATSVVVDWPPAVAILADADANGVDMIALETRGHSGLTKLVLGSVADKVLRGATVPVLLQRPDARWRGVT
jgi:nucleotide-binding universal stress UspA family protein